jgi:hypothetical protein
MTVEDDPRGGAEEAEDGDADGHLVAHEGVVGVGGERDAEGEVGVLEEGAEDVEAAAEEGAGDPGPADEDAERAVACLGEGAGRLVVVRVDGDGVALREERRWCVRRWRRAGWRRAEG